MTNRTAWTLAAIAGLLVFWAPARADVLWTDAAPFNSDAATDVDRDYYMHMTTDDAGHVVAVWCAAVSAAQDRDFDIYVSHSADDGVTWSAQAILDPYAVDPPEIEDDFHPFVVTDDAGHWIAAWYSWDNHGGTIGDDIDILYSRSDDNGATWTSSEPLNSDAATDTDSDYTPSIATDGNGLWVAVWYKALVTDGDDDIVISHSTNNGQTWSPLELLHPSMATDNIDDSSPTIVADKTGHWMVVWNAYDLDTNGIYGTDLDIFASSSTNGYAWTAPAPVNSDAADANGVDDKVPRLATDDNGRWLAVWYYYDSLTDEYDIRYSYSDDNGATWSPPGYVNTNHDVDFGTDYYPVPATDGDGNWIAVWQSKESFNGYLGVDYDILYATSTDNGATWSAPWFVNSFAPAPIDFGYDRDPEIVHLGGHRWLTVWGSDFDVGGIGSEYDLLQAMTCFPQVPGDQDCDGDVDLRDFGGFQQCFGAASPLAYSCASFDIDTNGAVDIGDLPDFTTALDGPGR